MDKTYHIVIRPRSENFDFSWRFKLCKAFSNFMKYSITIALEKGDKSDKYNHIDMTVTCIGGARQDNIRAKVLKALSYVPVDDEESKRWIKVLPYKDDFRACHGYSMKEHRDCNIAYEQEMFVQGELAGKWVWMSSRDDLEECILVYDSLKKNHQSKCNSLNKLLQVAEEYYDNNKEEFGNEVPSLRAICVDLVKMEKIPLSLGVKVKKGWEIFWQHWIRELSMFEIEHEISRLDN